MTDEARIAAWYLRYRKPLERYLTSCSLRMLPEDAADVVQETFVQAIRKASSYRGDAEWRYLKVTAHNLGLNHIRAQGTQMRRGTVPLEAAFDAHDDNRSAEQELMRSEATQDVKRRYAEIMSGVPELTRLCFYEQRRGLSYKEIAAKLDTTVAAVQSRLYDLRQRFLQRVGALPPDIDWPTVAGETGHDHEE